MEKQKENSLKIHQKKLSRRENLLTFFPLSSNLLYGLLSRHMSAGIERVGRRPRIDVERGLDAHAKCHHRTQLQAHRTSSSTGSLIFSSPIMVAWKNKFCFQQQIPLEITVLIKNNLLGKPRTGSNESREFVFGGSRHHSSSSSVKKEIISNCEVENEDSPWTWPQLR